MRQLFRFKQDRAGNLPPLPGIFPDMMAPVGRRDQNVETNSRSPGCRQR
jgi:hypothetical protein